MKTIMSDSPPPSRPDPLPGWFAPLVERARLADGQPPFSDQSIVDARRGSRRVLAIDEIAVALTTETEAELVVDPDARGRGHASSLLRTLTSGTAHELRIWAHGDHPAARALAARFGFEAIRTLLQLRAAVESADSPPPANPAVRSFRDEDADAWVALNARAFASHPEQGAVTRADLDDLRGEPWFHNDDVLLLWDDSRLIGYCWLKIERPGAVGEFYVVGVDPDRQGEGLGRELVRLGLARLASRGIRQASLYVEADNTPALALYRSFGFREHTIDIQYALTRIEQVGFTQRSS